MIRNIIKIGNSQGIIIPRDVLQEIDYPKSVEITPTKDGILISPIISKSIRRKPRNPDESDGFYKLMKYKLNRNIETGKTKWIGTREMERRLE